MHMDTVLASFVVYDYFLFWVILFSHDMSDFILGNCEDILGVNLDVRF